MSEPRAVDVLAGVGLGLLGLALAWRLAVRPALLAQIAPEIDRQLRALPPGLGAAAQVVAVPEVAQAVGLAVRVVLERELP